MSRSYHVTKKAAIVAFMNGDTEPTYQLSEKAWVKNKAEARKSSREQFPRKASSGLQSGRRQGKEKDRKVAVATKSLHKVIKDLSAWNAVVAESQAECEIRVGHRFTFRDFAPHNALVIHRLVRKATAIRYAKIRPPPIRFR
jgi:hypothetical protein